MPAIAVGNLTPAERLRLIDDLGESLTSTPEAVPLMPLQRDELDRGDVELVPWEDVRRQLRARAR